MTAHSEELERQHEEEARKCQFLKVHSFQYPLIFTYSSLHYDLFEQLFLLAFIEKSRGSFGRCDEAERDAEC